MKTEIELLYEGTDISKDIRPFLLSLSHTDESSGSADDLQIELEDKDALWSGEWFPQKGDYLEATILKGEEKLYLGQFEIDELTYDDPPKKMTIKAVSAAVSAALRGEESTKSWENIRLKAIAQDVANKGGLELLYTAEYNPYYKRQDQSEQSDLLFLQDLCDKAGLVIKISDNLLIIFDEEEAEKQEPIAKFVRGEDDIISISFTSRTRDIYRACEVRYSDPASGGTFIYLYEPPNAPDTGQLLKINERVESAEEGAILARKRLREKNLKENECSMTIKGRHDIVSGLVIDISGWNTFDGKYYITGATQNVVGGWTTEIKMHKTLESYFVNHSNTIFKARKKKGRKSKSRKGRKGRK